MSADAHFNEIATILSDPFLRTELTVLFGGKFSSRNITELNGCGTLFSLLGRAETEFFHLRSSKIVVKCLISP
jgi:hypothetical protein